MYTNNRFSEDETAPERGVDGLLDELRRSPSGDDAEFLSGLEERLDDVDRTTAVVQQDNRFRWSVLVKVAAVAVILCVATFAIVEKQQRSDLKIAYSTNESVIAALESEGEIGEQELKLAKATRPVNELWQVPVPTVTLLPVDAVSERINRGQYDSFLLAEASNDSKKQSRSVTGPITPVSMKPLSMGGRFKVTPVAPTGSDAFGEFDAIEIAGKDRAKKSTAPVPGSAAVTAAREEMEAIMDENDIQIPRHTDEMTPSARTPKWASVEDMTETETKLPVVASPMAEQEITAIKTRIDALDVTSGENDFLATGAGSRQSKLQGVDAVNTSLQKRLAIAESSLESLKAIEAKGGAHGGIEDRKAYTQYFEARRRYEQALAGVELADSRQSRVRYPELVDTPFKLPAKVPLSTFSIDVDTASYSNVRRMIQSGESIPPDAVRIEELINYFDYSYANPGDELPFSVNLESAACLWKPEHRLVRVGLKGREVEAGSRQALNLVFLVDVSGSMNQERKLPLVQRSLHLLIDALREDDMITIVTYAGREGVALAPTKGSDKAAMHLAVDQLRSSGGTNGEAGIKLAYKLASENFSGGGVNRILLATDGDFNVGVSSTEALREMVKNEAKRGVFISVLGFGSDNLNDAMLETITNDGNGTYHYIDSVSEGRKVLVDDLTSTMITIAKDVKIQVEFNPATVGAYRLIGYANRKLPPEAFNDDRVDAGDIGAGHTVTAFYEIVPPGLEAAAATEGNLKYQVPVPAPVDPEPRNLTNTGSSELFTVKLRYKEPQGSISKLIEVPFTDNDRAFGAASADFRFAASVAAFGLQLRQSAFRGNLSREQVVLTATSAAGDDAHRREFVELVKNAVIQKLP
ncbi:MAG: secreted protein with Ig-like and vWFA domain [Verrucomicrobiales bacterium]|jgi:secreted protein with Ig-like and vWFA domain